MEQHEWKPAVQTMLDNAMHAYVHVFVPLRILR